MSMKKQILIHGTPVGAVRIGLPAVIMDGGKTIRTSAVLAVYAESRYRLIFETQNTVYFLQYPEKSDAVVDSGRGLFRKRTAVSEGGMNK